MKLPMEILMARGPFTLKNMLARLAQLKTDPWAEYEISAPVAGGSDAKKNRCLI